jgi:hypothetical protein
MLLAAHSSVPSWIQWAAGLSAPAAVALTITVVLRDWRSRRRDQASRISAWAEAVEALRSENEEGATISGEPGQVSVRVRVRNASEAPVYDFHVWVHYDYSPDSPVMGSQERHILPPGETVVYADWVELPKSGLAGKPYVDLSFKDERGRRWQRLFDGGLGPDRLSREGRRKRRSFLEFRNRAG